jgi:iron complex outermembrane receptor protein
MKIKFLLLSLLIAHLALAQNKGTIKGFVKTSDGQAATFVTVTLKGTNKGTSTDNNGAFEIRNVEQGVYTLVTTFVGLQTKEQQVEVTSGETVTVPEIFLSESAYELNEVVVSDFRSNPFDRKQSEFVARLPLKNIENPQVYNTISAELLKDQVVTNFEDALKNAPGVEKLWESTGRGGDGAGYFSLRGFQVQPTMVNGLPGLTNGSLDPANIERIEVIKGPSGTLFGSSLISYGGLINTVTKKPYRSFGGEVSYIAGSFGLNRITADVNLPVNEQVSVRVNTAYHTENSFQDAGFKNSFFLAPSLLYEINDRLSFWINAEFLSAESTNPTMLFLNRSNPLQYADLNELNYNNKLSLTSNDITIKNPRYNLQAQMNYKLSDHWTSQTAISRGAARSDGYYSYLWDNYVDKGEFSLFISDQNAQTTITDIQQNFIGDFEIAGMRNRLVAGLDYFHRQVTDNGTGYPWFYDVTPHGEINYEYPYSDLVVEPRSLSRQAVDAVMATAARSNRNVKDESYSAYFSDVINFTPKLSAMASLRLDYFRTEGDITREDDDYNQTALSPKFGVVYQPLIDKLALFVNYMNGFKNVAPRPVIDADGNNQGTRTFEPEHANQMEFGIKANLFSDRLSSTISYYDITVSNKIMADGLNSIQGGEVASTGFEISINANPIRGLNVIGGYSFNESTVVEGEPFSSFAEEGKRPAEAGPQHILNAWAVYNFVNGPLKGFGLGFGGNSASERLIMDSKVIGKFALPAYTVLNASVFYNAEAFRLTIKVDNLTNEEYYKGWSTINPQRPRSVSASFAYRF